MTSLAKLNPVQVRSLVSLMNLGGTFHATNLTPANRVLVKLGLVEEVKTPSVPPCSMLRITPLGREWLGVMEGRW